MARHAEIRAREIRGNRTYLYCRIYMDGPPDVDGKPTIVELGEVEIPDGGPNEVRSALVAEAQRLQQLPVGKVIDL